MPGRDHATHNETLCELLIEKGQFDDWVITTAFYSAIHLVDHQIFPLTIGPQPTFINLNQYINRLRPPRSRHEVRRDLVAKNLPTCAVSFCWLMDECYNARYNQYKVNPVFAKRAKGCLESIKKNCSKP